MVTRGRDGTLWSALTGVAFDGLQKGRKLERIPNIVTDWSYWLMLHPESTAYDLFDGKRYPIAELPAKMSREATETMGKVDPRLKPKGLVCGVELHDRFKAYPLDGLNERTCFADAVGGDHIAIFWYGPTRTSTAYSCSLDGRTLSFFADGGSPETAPFKDKETGTRWTMAGRGVDGPLRGKELTWVNSIQCRWYAWANEHPGTEIYASSK